MNNLAKKQMSLTDTTRKLIGAGLWGGLAGALACYGFYWCFPYEKTLMAGLLFLLLAPLLMRFIGEEKTVLGLIFLTSFGALGVVGALINSGLASGGLDFGWVGPVSSLVAFGLAFLVTRKASKRSHPKS